MPNIHEIYANRAALRERLSSLAKTVADEKDVRLKVTDKKSGGHTDAVKNITIGDPSVLMAAGFDEETAIDSAVVTTVHEGAHILARSKTDALGKYMDKLVKDKRERKDLVYACLDAAEDVRVDAVMSKERPGYEEMRTRSAQNLVTKLYKPDPKDPELNVVRVAVAKVFAGVDVLAKGDPSWRGALDMAQRQQADQLATMLASAATAKDCAAALKIGHRAFRKVFGFNPAPESKGSGSEGKPEPKKMTREELEEALEKGELKEDDGSGDGETVEVEITDEEGDEDGRSAPDADDKPRGSGGPANGVPEDSEVDEEAEDDDTDERSAGGGGADDDSDGDPDTSENEDEESDDAEGGNGDSDDPTDSDDDADPSDSDVDHGGDPADAGGDDEDGDVDGEPDGGSDDENGEPSGEADSLGKGGVDDWDFDHDYASSDEESEAAIDRAVAESSDAADGEHSLTKLLGVSAKETIEKASKALDTLDKRMEALATAYKATCPPPQYSRPKELIDADRAVSVVMHTGMMSFYDHDTGVAVYRGGPKLVNEQAFPILVRMRSELTSKLTEEFRRAKEADQYLHKSGFKVASSKVWRATHLQRPDVMIRKEEKALGNWHVDIWLDASGSNQGRVTQVRAMAWVLVSSLRACGIDVRLYSWNNHSTLQIKPLITSGADPILNVNRYLPAGDNRDGHTLGIATELIKNVQADHKLLVWISDGEPSNNSSGLSVVGGVDLYHAGSDPTDPVLMDLAKAVKAARKVCPFLPMLINDKDSLHQMAAVYYGTDYVPVKAPASNDTVVGLEQIPAAVHRFIAKLLRQ